MKFDPLVGRRAVGAAPGLAGMYDNHRHYEHVLMLYCPPPSLLSSFCLSLSPSPCSNEKEEVFSVPESTAISLLQRCLFIVVSLQSFVLTINIAENGTNTQHFYGSPPDIYISTYTALQTIRFPYMYASMTVCVYIYIYIYVDFRVCSSVLMLESYDVEYLLRICHVTACDLDSK